MNSSRWRRNLKALITLSLITLFLTGCWDRLEIEERAVILSISVDVADPKESEKEPEVAHLEGSFEAPTKSMLRITAQIAVPGRIPLGPGGFGGSATKKPVWVLSTTGHTIDDALMVLQQQLADRIFLGHLRMIVISEAFAKRGVANLNDYLRRNPEVRRLAWMVVSKGRAEKFMEAAPELERVPALYMLAMMDHAVEMGKYPNEFIGIFWSKNSSLGREGNLPYVHIQEKDNIEIDGMSYFHNNHMVGRTAPLDIGVYMALTNEKRGGYTAFAKIRNTNDFIMFRSTNRSTSTKVSIKNGNPHFTIDVLIEGNIEEKLNEQMSKELYNIQDEKQIKNIQDQLTTNAIKASKKLIKQTQDKKSDIFGFGEYVRAKEPAYWNRHIRTKDEWSRQYKDVTLDINYTFKIRRLGMESH